MPRSTPKRAGMTAPEGARFLEEVLATNVRGYRRIREMDQAELARRMSALGLGWDAGTVGFVERGDRNVTLSEVLGLMLVLGKSFAELVDPTGPDGSVRATVEIGVPSGPMDASAVRDWLDGGFRMHVVQYEPEMKVTTELRRPGDRSQFLERLWALEEERP